MSGILNAILAGRSSKTYSVTIGTGGASNYGYSPGSFGAISDTNVAGRTFTSLATDETGTTDFTLGISGAAVSQGYIHRVVVQDTAGATRTYLTSNATFGPGNFWYWGNGSSRVWTATTPSPRSVTISF